MTAPTCAPARRHTSARGLGRRPADPGVGIAGLGTGDGTRPIGSRLTRSGTTGHRTIRRVAPAVRHRSSAPPVTAPPAAAPPVVAPPVARTTGRSATGRRVTRHRCSSCSLSATGGSGRNRRLDGLLTARAGRALRRTLLVALLRLRRVRGEQVLATRRERRVVALRDVDVLHFGTRDLGDLVEARRHEVHGQRRVAERRRLLLRLTHRVVRELGEGAALGLVELAADLRRQDEVRVRRQLVVARIGVGVHAAEVLREVRRRDRLRWC